MTDHSVAIDSLAQSCRRLMGARDGVVAEQQRHQAEIAELQRRLIGLTTDIDSLNGSIIQLGGDPVTSAATPAGQKE